MHAPIKEPNGSEPNLTDIKAHLYALFSPEFVAAYPDAWIEIGFAHPNGKLDEAKNYSAFELREAAEFAEAKNREGFNIYVGAALRHGKQPRSGRANAKDHFLAARCAWIEYDGEGDHERIAAICKAEQLDPAMLVITGTTPRQRAHLYFLNASPITDTEELVATNTALRERFGSDAVQDACRVLRLAGTVNYPSPKKTAKGYIVEPTTLRIEREPSGYSVDALCALPGKATINGNAVADRFEKHGASFKPGKSDDELIALLKQSRATPGQGWREPIVNKFIPSTIRRGWTDLQIRLACAPYSDGGVDDPEIQKEINYVRNKFGKPEVDGTAAGDGTSTAAKAPANSEEFLSLIFAERHEADLRFVAKWGQWFRWDGGRWLLEETLHAFDMARMICRAAANAANKLNVAKTLASAKTVAAVERLAKADRKLAATVEQWDTAPNKFNTAQEE